MTIIPSDESRPAWDRLADLLLDERTQLMGPKVKRGLPCIFLGDGKLGVDEAFVDLILAVDKLRDQLIAQAECEQVD